MIHTRRIVYPIRQEEHKSSLPHAMFQKSGFAKLAGLGKDRDRERFKNRFERGLDGTKLRFISV
jgi:hypothetical protein